MGVLKKNVWLFQYWLAELLRLVLIITVVFNNLGPEPVQCWGLAPIPTCD